MPDITPQPEATDKIAAARADGYSWSDIGATLAPKISAAKQDGYSDQDIAKYYGAKDPTIIQKAIDAHIARSSTPNFDEAEWEKGYRQTYVDSIKTGPGADQETFFHQLGHSLLYGNGPTSLLIRSTIGAAKGVSELLGIAGDAAAPFAGSMGGSLGPAGAVAGPVAAAGSKALQIMGKLGKSLPSFNELLDGAVALQQQNKLNLSPGKTAEAIEGLANHFVETGEAPSVAALRAQNDPALRTELLTGKKIEKAGDSVTREELPLRERVNVTQDVAGRVQDEYDEQKKNAFIVPRPEGYIFNTPEEVPKETLETFARLEGSSDTAVSKTGAVGHWQILPSTAKEYGFDPEILKTREGNEQVARTIIADLSRKYKGDEEAMAVAYNAGPKRADAWLETGKARSTLPEETQKYLTHLDAIHGGEPPKPPGEPPATPPPEPPPEGSLEEAFKKMDDRVDTTKPSYLDQLYENADKFYTEMFHGDYPLTKLQKAIEAGKPLPDDINPTFLRRLTETDTTARYAISEGMFDLEGNKVGPAFKDILPKGAEETANLRRYMIAKWAVEKADQAKETGVDIDAAKKVVGELGEKYQGKFEDVVNFQNGTLQWLRDAGILDPKTFDKIIEENKSRIPGYRVDDGLHAPGASKAVYNPVKQFFGSDKKINDPYNAILEDTFARAALARKAIADRALADAAGPAGFARKLRTQAFKLELTPEEMQKFGMADLDNASIWRSLSTGLKTDEVPIFRGGKREVWHFSDPDVTSVLKGLDHQSLALWQKLERGPTRFARTMTVLNPSFPLRLLTYDMPWQFITKPGLRNVIADNLVGLNAIVRKTDDWDRYLRSGAAERVFGGLAKEDYLKNIMKGTEDPSFSSGAYNLINSVPRGLKAWADTVTQSQRVGRFIRGTRAGESDLRAGVASTEAAFHRSGFGGPASRNINALHPFFSAQLNSMDQMFRSQFGIGSTVTGEHFKAWQFTAKASALVTVPMLMNWYNSKDEEWYKAAPDWQKNSGLIFHTGDPKDGYTWYIPMPPLLGFIYGGLPRMLAERYLNDDPHAFDHSLGSAFESVLPPGFRETAALATPIIEHVANYSFFRGRPLVSDSQKDALGPEQASPWSSGTARALSQFASDHLRINPSPQAIDNYIQGWSGSLGTMAIRTADLLLGTGPHGDKAPASTVADWPGISSWMARYPSANAQPIQTYYDTLAKLRDTEGSIEKAMAEGNVDRVKQLITRMPIAGILMIQRPQGMTKLLIGTQPQEISHQYQQIFSSLAQSTASQQMNIQKFVQAEAALKQEGLFVAKIQNIESNKISPTDRKQMLDMHYSAMQKITEQLLPIMDKLGIK